jgi:hypothetical protein
VSHRFLGNISLLDEADVTREVSLFALDTVLGFLSESMRKSGMASN